MPDESRPPAPWCSRDPVLRQVVVSRIASSRRASHHRQISEGCLRHPLQRLRLRCLYRSVRLHHEGVDGVPVRRSRGLCRRGEPGLWPAESDINLGFHGLSARLAAHSDLRRPSGAVHRKAERGQVHGQLGRSGWNCRAADAVAKAKALGMLPGTAIYGDMENYSTTDATCRTAVLTFVSAWTKELHRQGYLSGMYANLSLGATQLSDSYNSSTYARPDALWIARWDSSARSPGGPAFQIRNGQIISAASSTGATTTRRTAVSRSTLTAIASTRLSRRSATTTASPAPQISTGAVVRQPPRRSSRPTLQVRLSRWSVRRLALLWPARRCGTSSATAITSPTTTSARHRRPRTALRCRAARIRTK